jgi:hypothetical protein
MEAVRDQLRFAGVDEIHESPDPRFEFVERTLSDVGMIDVHDGL